MCVKALSTLLSGTAELPSVLDMTVHGLTADSRQVRPGDAFVALRGSARDAWRYVDEAVAAGAVAILLETERETGCTEYKGVLVVSIPELSRIQSAIADRFFESPSKALHMIGVTGTNGKSSVTRYIAEILNAAGLRTATLGTLGYGFPEAMVSASHTTPDVITVQRWLHQFRKDGAAAVVMEVSSHALDQGRVEGVKFEGAVFTNLSRDHLDYHRDMEDYGAAKARLFTKMNPRFAVINQDDAFGREVARKVAGYCQLWRYSLNDPEAEIHVSALTMGPGGFDATVASTVGSFFLASPLLGRFNVSNMLAAAGAVLALNIEPAVLSAVSREISAPPGRLQQFVAPSGLRIVVDYAHTPDALATALEALRSHTGGQLWCVFGCGGDRDPGKRALMGDIAARLADRVVLTDDNPRGEAPEAIVASIVEGFGDRMPALVEHDRRRAIEWAVTHAAPADIVLVAGKGHEDYQERAGKRHPYSDIAVVEALAARTSSVSPGGTAS